MKLKQIQSGFTLVEIAIVLLIVAILLGYTVALFPQQQRLKQYRALEGEMDRVIEAVIGFAQVNGRLPCPALPNSGGDEDLSVGPPIDGCNNYGGFVPVNTLGLDGRLNADSLLLDPWGNPYRYYVTNVDFDPGGGANGLSDFTTPGEMRSVGLGDLDADDYVDLDARYIICDGAGAPLDSDCDGDNEVIGRFQDNGGAPNDRYAGVPVVLVSMGPNWTFLPGGEELVNSGGVLIVGGLGVTAGPSGTDYLIKNVGAGETTFVRPLEGLRDDFDDVVRWISPSVLFSRMIEADQLP